MKKMKRILRFSFIFIAMILLSTGAVFSQGSTTGGLSGLIVDDGGPLPGATVIALHVPTGSEYATISNIQGNYILRNMKVGDNYQVTVSYVGFKDQVATDISITVGKNLDLDFELMESATELAGVDVVADPYDQFDANRTGAETNVNERAIKMLPNASRSLNDFTRLTPQAKITPGGGLSIAGTNNRYNAVYIDGAVSNDVFGLAANGMNGGQIGISPISIDAIEQFQVVIAPYDVRQGGFAGGGVNAVTRSGTNDWAGSAYFLMRNQDLAGKTPTVVGSDESVKLPDFTANTYGFRVGGPIIKNKLHFFANVEIQRDETPQPFDFSSYTGAASAGDIASLVNKLNELGYDPGSYTNNTRKLDGQKYLFKIDWNISQKHKLTLRYFYTEGQSLSPAGSSPTRIRFENSGIDFISKTNSFTAELNSTWATTTNNLIVTFTSVNDNRDPMGNPFPYIDIREGDVEVGSEQFSTANLLEQKIFTLTDNFDFYKGKHTITVGTHNEFYNINNVFIRQNFGSYDYNSISDFVNDETATQYERSYSLIDDVTGDGTDAAAKFKAAQLGFYAQDDIKFSERFNLIFGLRFDIPFFLDDPVEDTYFNTTTVGLIEAEGWDLKGARAGQAPKAQFLVSPRIGFNYKLNESGATQLRGGLGIFTSRVPFVWPGGMYNNNGLTVGGVRAFDDDGDIPFNPDPFNQPTKGDFPGQGGDVIPQGQMDLFAEDFKYPQVFRASVAIDQKFGNGWVFTFEALFTKTLNNVFYENLNLRQSVENFDGTPDTRPIYDRGNEVDDTYTRILLGSNTSDGYTSNFTLQLQKQFTYGLDAYLAYTYGSARAVYEGTSSQNSSQWRGGYSVAGRNFAEVGISDFDLAHRWVGALNYRIEYAGFLATAISVVYTGQTGNPFTYAYDDGFTNEDSRQRAQIYVPRNSGEIMLGTLDDNDAFVPADESMWTALDNYISNDDYLKDRRGEYAEKNAARAPFLGIVDLKIQQDFFIQTDKMRHTLTIGFDIFNFTNMLNKDWGKRYNVPNGDGTSVYLLNYEGNIDGTNTPVFTFNEDRETSTDYLSPDDAGLISSRWQAQLSIRYTF